MNKKLFFYLSCGFIFTIIAGIFSAFGYSASSQNPLVGMFCPISTSPWETLKLIFFPSFLYILSGWLLFRKTHPDFLCIGFTGLLSGSFLFLPLFYTYSGILGGYSIFLTFVCLFIASYLIYYFSYTFIQYHYHLLSFPFIVCILVSVLVSFFYFTYQPPAIPLFTPILYTS